MTGLAIRRFGRHDLAQGMSVPTRRGGPRRGTVTEEEERRGRRSSHGRQAMLGPGLTATAPWNVTPIEHTNLGNYLRR